MKGCWHLLVRSARVIRPETSLSFFYSRPGTCTWVDFFRLPRAPSDSFLPLWGWWGGLGPEKIDFCKNLSVLHMSCSSGNSWCDYVGTLPVWVPCLCNKFLGFWLVTSVLYRKCTLELSWSRNNCTVSQYMQYMCTLGYPLDSFQICHTLSTTRHELWEGLKKKKIKVFNLVRGRISS